MTHVNITMACTKSKVMALRTESSTRDLFSSGKPFNVPPSFIFQLLNVEKFDETIAVDYHL